MTVATVQIEKSLHIQDGLEVTLKVYCPSRYFDYNKYFDGLLAKIKKLIIEEEVPP